MSKRFAASTSVPVSRSKIEIENLLRRCRAAAAQPGLWAGGV